MTLVLLMILELGIYLQNVLMKWYVHVFFNTDQGNPREIFC